MTTKKPAALAKALHTVTAVARVATYLACAGSPNRGETLTREALAVLGYNSEQIDNAAPELIAACVAAVVKACGPERLPLSGAELADRDRRDAGRALALVC